MRKTIFLITILCILSVCITIAQNTDTQFKLAQSYEETGDFDNALRIYNELYEQTKSVKYFDAVAKIYKQFNQFAELNNLIDERLTLAGQNDCPLLILAAETKWKLGETDQSNKLWKQIATQCEVDVTAQVQVANSLMTLKLYDKAITFLSNAKKTFPDKIEIPSLLIRCYAETNNFTYGYNELIYVLDVTNDVNLAITQLNFFLANEKALTFFNNAFAVSVENTTSQSLLTLYSWYLRATSQYEKALSVTIKLDSVKNARGGAILEFADDAQKDSQVQVAIDAYEVLIARGKNSPYSNQAAFRLVQTLDAQAEMKGNTDKNSAVSIINKYQAVLNESPSEQNIAICKLRIATIYEDFLASRQDAISTLQSLIASNANILYKVQATNALATLLIKSDKIEEARNTLKTLIDKVKTTSNSVRYPIATALNEELITSELIIANILYYQGLFDEAETAFQKITTQSDKDAANDAFEKLYFIQNNSQSPKALRLFANAELLSLQSNYDSAANEFLSVEEIATGEQIAELAAINAAKAELATNQSDKANAILNKYLDAYAAPLYADDAIFILAGIAETASDKDAAISLYMKLLSAHPRSVLVNAARKRVQALRASY